MALVRAQKSPLWIRIVALAGALVLAILIARMVFMFGYVASGLASLEREQKEKRDRPIAIQFADPNVPAPGNADPNS